MLIPREIESSSREPLHRNCPRRFSEGGEETRRLTAKNDLSRSTPFPDLLARTHTRARGPFGRFRLVVVFSPYRYCVRVLHVCFGTRACSARRQEPVAVVDRRRRQPADPVARPTGGETGHRAGGGRAASDPAAVGRPVRFLPHTETGVEPAARLPQARPARHVAVRQPDHTVRAANHPDSRARGGGPGNIFWCICCSGAERVE